MPCPRPLTTTVSSILSKCMALLRRHEDEDGLACRSIRSMVPTVNRDAHRPFCQANNEKRRWPSRLGASSPDKKDPDKYLPGCVDDHADRRCRGRRMQPAE